MSDNTKLWVLFIGVICLAIGAAAVADDDWWRGIKVEPEDACLGIPYEEDLYRYDRPSILENYWRFVGSWYSPYDDKVYGMPMEIDVEHRVAKQQAHHSGLCRRDKAAWSAYASDITNITIAESHLNRVIKGDKDAAGWTPDKNRCHFAISVAQTKCDWGLSVDAAERDALERIIQKDCPGAGVQVFACAKRHFKDRVEA